jgi:hypothetical protein
MVPTVELPPATPFTLQLTAVFEVPVTVAVNCCCPPMVTWAVVGESVTVTVAAVTVTLAEEEALEEA